MPDPIILIAEDNPGLARVLSFKLKSSGFTPVICSDGQIAWEEFQKHDVAAILSDQEMPRMSGLEFCEKVRSVDRHVPFFLVTGRQMELMSKGVDEDLAIRKIFGKPFSPADVVAAVHAALQSTTSPACEKL